jgi:hypothetical protein
MQTADSPKSVLCWRAAADPGLPVRAKLVGDPAGLALLDEMQAEHAQIDPILAALDEALWVPAGWTGSAAAPPPPGRCSIGPGGCRATGAAYGAVTSHDHRIPVLARSYPLDLCR